MFNDIIKIIYYLISAIHLLFSLRYPKICGKEEVESRSEGKIIIRELSL